MVGDDAYLAARVQLGIAVLDHYDASWRDVVDVDWLDLQSVTYCVVGQVFDRHNTDVYFDDGIRALGGPTRRDDESEGNYDERIRDWAVAHGFDVDPSGDDSYDDLTAAWRTALTTTITEEEE